MQNSMTPVEKEIFTNHSKKNLFDSFPLTWHTVDIHSCLNSN